MNVFILFPLAVGLATASALVTGPGVYDTKLTGASVSATELVANSSMHPALPPVFFCGESVPLHEGIIARRLVTALTSRAIQNRTLYRIRQRAAAFFPVIEPILEQYKIPADFKYLPLVESALQGSAVSPKGAVGCWQFMPATARELGLIMRPGYDERRNLIKSTHAACRYLNYLHSHLGSWTLAAAAYNNGIGALLANIRRQQQRNYYYLRLNAETGKYLYRILAFKELFANYRYYPTIIPNRMVALLSEPLTPEPAQESDEVLLPEVVVADATQSAVEMPVEESLTSVAGQAADIPLPNAADVFRGGIKARLTESGGVQRGQVWIFHLTRNGMADSREVEEGDILYAVVEDIDPKTDKIFLRADKLYSATDKHTYNLALAAVDASTGRIGIKLPDVDQIKSGWILTWKAL